MASTLKYVRVPPNSANLEEARRRVFEFFKTACRSIPQIMEIYNLDDVVTPSQLRSTVASEIRKNAHISNPKVIDLLLFKGTEELSNIVEHAKQRHHILGQYVVGHHDDDSSKNSGTKEQNESEFLKNFYKGNYF
ncbi:NADH dehydrogenase [ubiquinone] 1 alpha subcomplex subunit 6 [Andrographis paniculata]|uniref:NADH dehydrogenase [ubiquinone] 1 alpha subcomplex subunit 6 n=1 Tax=Andrographis paniculata TaxID=175694 RepID=UPI0021E801DF|nr:NADH dehydrogenase [ubiquinone] 1 alpha subcomplex subunit 6 [Andrographis paniculata]